jgi:integrase
VAKKLTAIAIDQAKPREARYEIADGGSPGLYLVVQHTGSKSWALRFRTPAGSKKLTLGPLAEVDSKAAPVLGHPLSLSQARALAGIARDQVKRGIDPAAVRQEEKTAARQEAKDALENTVDAAMIEFLRRYKGKKKQGLRDSTRNLTAHYLGLRPDPEKAGEWLKRTNGGVLRHWSGGSLASITKRDAIALLDKLVDDGTGVTANRTLTNLKTFFAWAVKRDMLAASPVASLDAPSEEASRERTLSDPELAALWKAADKAGYPFGRLIQLIILTGARRDEMREAPRSEFELAEASVALPTGGTWKGPLWMLPEARSKNGREHLVPLSAMAVEILEKLPRVGKSGLLFTTTGSTPVSGISRFKNVIDAAMLAESRKTDPGATLDRWTLHDLRRTFSTGLQRLGVSLEVIEECLNHKSGTRSGVAGVYARYRYLAEKTDAFEKWALHIASIVSDERKRACDNILIFSETGV